MTNKQNISFKRTKILATLGPASSDKDVIRKMILAGADIFRINFSHGSHETHARTIENVREASKELEIHIGILGDLQGPKIRTNDVENGKIHAHSGEELIITTGDEMGVPGRITTTYKTLDHDVNPGDSILIDDGNIELKVKSIDKGEVLTTVIHGGSIKSKKGINLPHTDVSSPSLTDKDKKDLKFALEKNLDWIALSFVRHEDDVIDLKKRIAKSGKKAFVVSKIEKPEAINRINQIIKETDAVMVARGDLGVELPMAQVPMIQKMIVNKCNKSAKPVIIATQMLESMINSPRPTRAETNDVANAVLDGADVVMLSAETAVGKFVVEAVKYMEQTIGVSEKESLYDYDIKKAVKFDRKSSTYINDHLISVASRLSSNVSAEVIVGITQSGYTALKLAAYRPSSRIFIFTSNKRTLTMLSLIWGITTIYYNESKKTDETIEDIENILKERGILKTGDTYITLGSMPVHEGLRTNMTKISVAK